MAAPLTQTQLPLNAILDQSGTQTYLGNSFILPFTGIQLTDTSEHPLAVIVNPAGSGKSLFLNQRKITSDNNSTLIRLYRAGVINTTGSATTNVNLRSGSATLSIALSYLGATLTSNGSLLAVLMATVYTISSDVLFILDPGTNLVVTGQQISGSMGNSNIYIENSWYEI